MPVAETILNWHYDDKLARFKVCNMQNLVTVWEHNGRISSLGHSFCKVDYHGVPFIFGGSSTFSAANESVASDAIRLRT